MHNAPSVSYPVGRCAFQRVTWLVLAAVAGAVMVVWFMQQPVTWPMCLSGAAALGGLFLGWRSLRTQSGILTWDGQVWCGKTWCGLRFTTRCACRWPWWDGCLHGWPAWAWP